MQHLVQLGEALAKFAKAMSSGVAATNNKVYIAMKGNGKK